MTDSSIYIEILSENGTYHMHNGWVDLNAATEFDSLVELSNNLTNGAYLKQGGYFMVTDVEGVAKHFHDGNEYLDFDAYKHCIEDLSMHDLSEEVFEAYMSNCHDWNAQHCSDAYCGHWESDYWSPMKNYAYDMFNSCNEIPDYLVNYIDWDAIERDFDMEHWESNGHIFHNC